MSADFEKVLVKDPRLDVTDSIKYAVIKGGQNVTFSKFQAVSSSSSQLVFNVQVPSEQTIIDRRVLLRATLKVKVTTSGNSLSGANVCYGINAALASFPLHQCMDTLSATINNNTVTCNVKDVLPAILRLMDDDDMCYNNGMTPAFNDVVGTYFVGLAGSAEQFLLGSNMSLYGATDQKRFHRGAFPIKSKAEAWDENVNNLVYEITEPLLLSPFMFAKTKANNQGFYGIQNMNIVANLNNGARAFRGPTPGAKSFLNPSGTDDANKGISAIEVDFWSVKPELLFTFLTPHPSDLMPARNIVPYYELPRYINSGQDAFAAGVATNAGLAVASCPLKFNAIQLNQIPDRLIFYARVKSSASNGWGIPDVALPIKSISINFNNNSGILASATQQELWQMSKNNGANTTWAEFCGWGTSVYSQTINATTRDFPAAVPLSGSYLILEFGKDIQLTEDFYASGSLGNFNLQCDIVAGNNTIYPITAGDVELVVVTMNSGVFVCERGTSATYTGILTKQDVLEASAQEYYTHDDVKRLVGGGFWDSIKSGVSTLAKKGMEKGKAHLQKHGKDYAHAGMKMAKSALSKYTSPEE